MEKEAYLLELFRKKAECSKNKEIIDEVSSQSFLDSLKQIADISDKLGINLFDSDTGLLPDINQKISKTLIKNYLTVYYVNLLTGEYAGYTTCDNYRALEIAEKGTDFFKDLNVNVDRVIYEKDREYIRTNLTKEKIVECIQNDTSYSLTYRLIINDEPNYVTLNVLKLADSDYNVVIGISNINEQKKQELIMKNKMKKSITYSNIALALARNFFTIYYVDTVTNEYEEYNLDTESQKLIKVNSGPQFFEESIVNAKALIHKEDLQIFLNALNKENLLREIAKRKTFRLTYRQMIVSKPVYMSLVALSLMQDSNHIIIGISNINEQKKQELEYIKNLEMEKTIARTDALTGAKNKYSYGEMEKALNDKIKSKAVLEFSVIVCDINNLKTINDSYGHAEGDKYIIEAYNILKDIFINSPIYRVGGDEFVLLLEGSDYYKRDLLLEELNEINKRNKRLNKVVLACGLADYDPKLDDEVVKTFTRADELMYKNKEQLKK